MAMASQHEAVAALDIDDSKRSVQTIGHEGILTTEQKCKMETLTTTKAAHSPLKSPGFRQKGIRREQLEKHITQMIREKFQAELTPPEPEVDYSSTTQRDFCVSGFVPSRPKSKHMHDYKFEQAITFWSENCQKIQAGSISMWTGTTLGNVAHRLQIHTQRADQRTIPSSADPF
ncbi:PREDICTED: sperm-associated antigen 8 [Cyprinodon variegatus]|uniref:sperm-associated antigen 8 n=1 Tax=Cyprinodon variegatus TaxID=28743 RepID=UPI000742C4F0|nr:PREDICTED: sperm-associated antigen 8 [Cyprinodon variegatus]